MVYGDDFIGRRESLDIVRSRVLGPSPASLAIIGLPKIGKSSLGWHSVMLQKEELWQTRILPVWICTGEHFNPEDFFVALVESTLQELTSRGAVTEPIAKAASSAVAQRTQTWANLLQRVKGFFRAVRDADHKVILLLDEFDRVRTLFHQKFHAFQALRDLADNPNYRIAYVTMSRRSLRDIERQSAAISSFENLFRKHYLPVFDSREARLLMERLAAVGVELTDDQREQCISITGRYPYFMAMLANRCFEQFQQNEPIDVESAAVDMGLAMMETYDQILDILKEENTLALLIETVVGPAVHAASKAVEEFSLYGLVNTGSNGVYRGFSSHFEDFLTMRARDETFVDYWPLWRKTERALRDVVVSRMLWYHGSDWISLLERKHAGLKQSFDGWRARQYKESRLFRLGTSRGLVDYSYPMELFALVFSEWEGVFQPIFGENKQYWGQRASQLSKVRTPLAHSRDESVWQFDIKLAEKYCQELLDIVASAPVPSA